MIKILKEAERAAVFRLGRFHRVAGPGLVFLIPLVDHISLVNLDQAIPDWKEAPFDELNRMVEFLVKRYPEVPVGLGLAEIREEMRRTEE